MNKEMIYQLKHLLIIIFTLLLITGLCLPAYGGDIDTSPTITYDPVRDIFLSVYDKNDGVQSYVYGSFVDTDGNSGAGFEISGSTIDYTQPAAAFGYDNGAHSDSYLAVWRADKIYGQLVNAADGSLINPTIIIASGATFISAPRVCFGYSSYKFLTVWSERSVSDNIYGQFINMDGSLDGGSFFIGNGSDPSVTYDYINDNFYVAWSDESNALGLLLDTDGTFLTPPAELSSGPSESSLAVAFNSHNEEYLAVWEDYRSGTLETYARIIGPDGTPLAQEYLVSDRHPLSAIGPAISYNESLNIYLLAWHNNSDTYCRLLSDDGAPLPFDGSQLLESDVTRPSVSSSNNHGYFMAAFQGAAGIGYKKVLAAPPTRQDVKISHDRVNNIYFSAYEKDIPSGGEVPDTYIAGHFVNPDGTLTGDEFMFSGSGGEMPALTYGFDADSNSHSFMAAWKEGDDIVVQTIDSDSEGVSAPYTVTNSASFSSGPAAAYDPQNKRFIVVWSDRKNPSDDIYGQFFDVTGTNIGGDFIICDENHDQDFPAITFDSANNRFLTVWQDYRNDFTSNIYGQLVDVSGPITSGPGGTATDVNFAVSNETHGKESPSVSFGSVGINQRFLVAWTDRRNGGGYDIYGQIIKADDLTTTGPASDVNFHVCDGFSSQSYPATAYDPVNKDFLVAWEDSRDIGTIYGQALDMVTGALAGTEFVISDEDGAQDKPSLAYNSADSNIMAAYEYEGIPVYKVLGGGGGDVTPPTVTGTSPADGAMDVSPGSAITVNFSEGVAIADSTIITLKDQGNNQVDAIVSAGGSMLTIDPADDLDYSSTYTVNIPAASVTDLAGNTLGGDCSFSFTTRAAAPGGDVTPPTVTGTSPADGAMDVSPGSAITVNFSEGVAIADSNIITLKDQGDNPVDATVSTGSVVLTIDPADALNYSSTYTVNIPAASVTDLAGNPLGGDCSFSFTTRAHTGGGGGSSITPVIEEPQTCSLSGLLTDSDGSPLSGLYVYAFPASGTGAPSAAITGRSGRYEVEDLAPGDYKIEFAPEALPEGKYQPEWFDNQRSWRNAKVITLSAGDAFVANASLDRQICGTIKGRLTAPGKGEGEVPLQGMSIYAFPLEGEGGPRGVRTDAGGNYQLEGLAPGRYKIEFAPETSASNSFMAEWHNNRRSWREADTLTLGADQTITVNALMDPPKPRAIGRQPLGSGAWYRVIIPAGALKDAQGNPLTRDYTITFTTGTN